MARKAQFSMDFLMVLGIMLVVFLLLMQFYIGKTESYQTTRQKESAMRITDSFASQINAAILAGNEARVSYPLPSTLEDGSNYSISVVNRRVEILFGKSEVSTPIQTSGVAAMDLNLKKGADLQISNQGGTILIS